MSGHSPDMREVARARDVDADEPARSVVVPRGAAGELQAVFPEETEVSAASQVGSFGEVYETYFDFVWRSARRLGVPEASLDDVVQDVFVTVYRRLPYFEGRSLLKTWIFGILRHTVRDLRRSMRRKPTEALEHEPQDGGHNPQEAAARGEGQKLLHEVLAALDEDQREVFVLCELEQLSAPEIASALEVNVNTVYSRLRAARQNFDAALKRLRSRDEWRMR